MFLSHVCRINSHLQIKFASYNSVESRNQIFPFIIWPFQLLFLRFFRFLGFHDQFWELIRFRGSFLFVIFTPLSQINACYFHETCNTRSDIILFFYEERQTFVDSKMNRIHVMIVENSIFQIFPKNHRVIKRIIQYNFCNRHEFQIMNELRIR